MASSGIKNNHAEIEMSSISGKKPDDATAAGHDQTCNANQNSMVELRQISDPEDARTKNEQPPREMRPWVWFMLSSAVLFATLLLALDNTIVADLQPQIVEALGEISKFPWINVTFNLGNVGTSLLWGKLYGSFSTKTLFITGVTLFEVGAAVSGAAPNMNAMIVGRAIGGIGGSGLYLGAMNIIAACTSMKERPLYFSFFGISWGIGTVVGPIVGGLFSQSPVGWRWSFYLNLVAGGIIIPIYLVCLPRSISATTTLVTRLKRIDFIGFVLFAGALLSGIMAVSFGGALYEWKSGQVIGLFCCAGILWMLFGLQQGKTLLTTKGDRVFPVNILSTVQMWILVGQTAASISVLFISLNYIPLYLQFVRSESALRAAVDLLPLVFTAVVFMLVTGSLMERLEYYKPWYLAGSALAVVGTVLMHTVGVNTSHGPIYGYTVLLSAGVSLYIQASYPIAQAKACNEEASDAVTVIGCTQVGSIALSLAISNSIFFNRAANGIQKVLPSTPRGTIQAAISGVGAPVFDDLTPAAKQKVLEVVTGAIQDVWVQATAAAALSLVLSLLMKWEKIPTRP